jgi:site-specific DNA recombinase
MTRQRREHVAQLAGSRRELAGVDRRLKEIMSALAEGYRSEAWKAELVLLDARTMALTQALAEPPIPALHPRMADVFRQKAATLAAGLEHDEHRDAAPQAPRGFLQSIIIPPGNGLLQVTGHLGAMLGAAAGQKMPGPDAVANVGCGGRI